jgi:membrane associated rhomboid family serine protease
MTYGLIAVNVAVYLLLSWPLSHQFADPADPMLRQYLLAVRDTLPPGVPLGLALRDVSAYDLVLFKFGFRPSAPEPLALLTSIFLHGGFVHLLGNMLFLWIYGDNVEYRLGRWRYLLYYLLTGMAATLFYAVFALGSKLPVVGASGAISGVLGFYFLWFPRNVVRLFVFLFPFFVDVVEVPARVVLGFYLLVDNLLPFVLTQGPQGGVAHGAHVGGFLAGLGLAWFISHHEERRASKEYLVYSASEGRPLGGTISEAIAQGELEGAARAYFALPAEATRRLLKPKESLALAEWLREHGHPDAALTVYRRQLRDHPVGSEAAEAHLGAGLVQLEALGQVAPAYQHFLEALELDPPRPTEERARAALRAIAQLQKYPVGRVAR